MFSCEPFRNVSVTDVCFLCCFVYFRRWGEYGGIIVIVKFLLQRRYGLGDALLGVFLQCRSTVDTLR